MKVIKKIKIVLWFVIKYVSVSKELTTEYVWKDSSYYVPKWVILRNSKHIFSLYLVVTEFQPAKAEKNDVCVANGTGYVIGEPKILSELIYWLTFDYSFGHTQSLSLCLWHHPWRLFSFKLWTGQNDLMPKSKDKWLESRYLGSGKDGSAYLFTQPMCVLA